jgi:signal transduction histidine kinase
MAPAQGYVLYRAVQEALTNARRHALGSPVTVEFVAGDGQVRAVVRNDLGGELPGAPGRGLIGMRERVEAVGGVLVTGPQDGVYIVDVTLPVPIEVALAAPVESAAQAARGKA